MGALGYRTKLLGTFGLLLLLVAVPVLVAWTAAEQLDRLNERSRIAHEVLDAHLTIAELGQLLLRTDRGAEALPTPSEDLRRHAEVEAQFRRARAAIVGEMELIGTGGAGEELEELTRLDDIRSRLDRAIAGNRNTGWRDVVFAAVDEERRELRQADAAARSASRVMRLMLGSCAFGAILIAAVLLYLFQHSVRLRLNRLIAGMQALATGDFAHRIRLDGQDEFAEMAQGFDLMAETLQRQNQAIADAREALEETVAARTSALEAANARLAEAGERRRQFLADISHELRTPLTIIRGEAEVSLRGVEKPADTYREALSRIVDQALGMGRLVDDLLFVARTDAGEPRLNLRPLLLAPFLERCVASVRSFVESDGGGIDMNFGCEPSVIGDPDRLRQLVNILLDNAIRYSSDAPRIAVSLLASPNGVTVQVSDNGIGIAAADLPHIFDRYRRGERAERKNGDGVGLGLPMAKAIVEAHGGTITIESVEDVGTTVSVFLPTVSGLRAIA